MRVWLLIGALHSRYCCDCYDADRPPMLGMRPQLMSPLWLLMRTGCQCWDAAAATVLTDAAAAATAQAATTLKLPRHSARRRLGPHLIV